VRARGFAASLLSLLALTVAGWAGARMAVEPWRLVLDNLHWTAAYLAATLLAWHGLRARQGFDEADRVAMRWFVAGLACLTIGQVVWNFQLPFGWTPFPGPSDAFFLLLGPAFAMAYWRIGRLRLGATQWRMALLDTATVLVATLAATLALFLPRQGAYSLYQILVMVGYELGLMAPACLGFILILALRARLDWRSLLLPAATWAMSAQWMEWNLRFLADRLVDGAWLNLSFSAVALLMGVAVAGFRLETVEDEHWDRRCEGILRLLPLMMVVLAAAGIVLAGSLDGVPPGVELSVIGGGGVVVVMAAIRQSLLLRERDRLVAAERLLRQREAELESKVSERTRELSAAKEAADAANRSKSVFLANISHEIRTPMNSVIGMAHLALQDASNPVQRDYLERIQSSGQHLLALINVVLDLSKIEGGKLELELVDFELANLMTRLRAQLQAEASRKGLALEFDIDPALAVPLLGDPLRLEQVLLNYLGNAIKFTERGHIIVRVRAVEADDGRGRLVRFEVEDTGTGLTPQAMSTLFQMFHQADSSTTRKHGGTGLGLAISKQLVSLMGGDVGVDSVPGVGSTFWFTARLGAGRSLPEAEHEVPPDTRVLNGARVLVVEDNEFNQVVAAAMLNHMGAVVSLAGNGEEALAQLHVQHYDCVLMDVQMPLMDGLEATRRIRAEPSLAGTTIIAMTANAWSEDRAACLAAGMDDFVAKPVEPGRLYGTLARWISGEGVRAGGGGAR